MAAQYPCPDGHISTEPDYCSECGKKLNAGPSGLSAPAAAATTTALPGAGGETCPDCSTPRASTTAVFCEVCRYNFTTKTPWTPGGAVAAASSAPPAPSPAIAVSPAPSLTPIPASAMEPVPAVAAPPPSPPPVPGPAVLRRWEVAVVADASLYVDPDPDVPCPVGEPERVFPLDFAENLIGRRSERRAIFPEINLASDTGVSSRHAILYREANGNLSLLDVGSTNGTQLNGQDVQPGVRTPLKDGDQITLGCWTRMTVRAVGSGMGGQP